MVIDYLIQEWFESDSDRSIRAIDNLIEAIAKAPDNIPLHDIDGYVDRRVKRFRTGRDHRRRRSDSYGDNLTPRQKLCLQMRASGLSEIEIAQRLKISRDTVKNHLKACRVKLGALDTTNAIVLAIRSGIIV